MSDSSYIHAGDRFVMLRTLEDGSVAPVLMEVCHELHSSHAPGRSCGTALYRVDPEVWPNQAKFSENVNMSNREVREYINHHSPELFLQTRVRELMDAALLKAGELAIALDLIITERRRGEMKEEAEAKAKEAESKIRRLEAKRKDREATSMSQLKQIVETSIERDDAHIEIEKLEAQIKDLESRLLAERQNGVEKHHEARAMREEATRAWLRITQLESEVASLKNKIDFG